MSSRSRLPALSSMARSHSRTATGRSAKPSCTPSAFNPRTSSTISRPSPTPRSISSPRTYGVSVRIFPLYPVGRSRFWVPARASEFLIWRTSRVDPCPWQPRAVTSDSHRRAPRKSPSSRRSRAVSIAFRWSEFSRGRASKTYRAPWMRLRAVPYDPSRQHRSSNTHQRGIGTAAPRSPCFAPSSAQWPATSPSLRELAAEFSLPAASPEKSSPIYSRGLSASGSRRREDSRTSSSRSPRGSSSIRTLRCWALPARQGKGSPIELPRAHRGAASQELWHERKSGESINELRQAFPVGQFVVVMSVCGQAFAVGNVLHGPSLEEIVCRKAEGPGDMVNTGGSPAGLFDERVHTLRKTRQVRWIIARRGQRNGKEGVRSCPDCCKVLSYELHDRRLVMACVQ